MLGAVAVAAALGCARTEPILMGEAYPPEEQIVVPTVPGWHTPPTAKGGGPNSHDYPDDLDLGHPDECPEGFDDEDDTEFSPAHPPHLKKGRGVEDNI